MELKLKTKAAPAKEWTVRHAGRTWGPLSLHALITLIRDEAFPACEAEIANAEDPDAWTLLKAREKLIALPTIREEIEASEAKRAKAIKQAEPRKPCEPIGPVLVKDMIQAARVADTANFDRKIGTPPKIRETDDKNDVGAHLREISSRLDSKKEKRAQQAKKGEACLRTLLWLKALAAASIASKTYFIMGGMKEFLLGILLFLPLILGLRWCLKKTQ